jgi:hypothetical protein
MDTIRFHTEEDTSGVDYELTAVYSTCNDVAFIHVSHFSSCSAFYSLSVSANAK